MLRLWTVDQEVVGSNTTTHEINLYRELLYQVYSADLVNRCQLSMAGVRHIEPGLKICPSMSFADSLSLMNCDFTGARVETDTGRAKYKQQRRAHRIYQQHSTPSVITWGMNMPYISRLREV